MSKGLCWCLRNISFMYRSKHWSSNHWTPPCAIKIVFNHHLASCQSTPTRSFVLWSIQTTLLGWFSVHSHQFLLWWVPLSRSRKAIPSTQKTISYSWAHISRPPWTSASDQSDKSHCQSTVTTSSTGPAVLVFDVIMSNKQTISWKCCDAAYIKYIAGQYNPHLSQLHNKNRTMQM